MLKNSRAQSRTTTNNQFLLSRITRRTLSGKSEECVITNILENQNLPSVIVGDGSENHPEGDERSQNRVIQGTIVKFTNTAEWVTRDEEKLSADQELIATGILRVLQKWVDHMPEETRILQPGENVDLEALNEAVPKDEWVEGPDGKPRGPWQCQYLVYLLDPKTMDRYTYATGTTGGGIAVRDLRDKCIWMRRMRGQNIFAVVTLADRHMKTKFGGRQRPHFVVVRWIALGGDNANALPAPALREIEAPKLAEDLGEEGWDATGDPLPADLDVKAAAPKKKATSK
jgi:hypothetical protein